MYPSPGSSDSGTVSRERPGISRRAVSRGAAWAEPRRIKSLAATRDGNLKLGGAVVVYKPREPGKHDEQEEEEEKKEELELEAAPPSPPPFHPLTPRRTPRPYPGNLPPLGKPPPLCPREMRDCRPAEPGRGGWGGRTGGGACGGGGGVCGGGVGGVGFEFSGGGGGAAVKGGGGGVVVAAPPLTPCPEYEGQCLGRGETSGSLRSGYEVYIDYDNESK